MNDRLFTACGNRRHAGREVPSKHSGQTQHCDIRALAYVHLNDRHLFRQADQIGKRRELPRLTINPARTTNLESASLDDPYAPFRKANL